MATKTRPPAHGLITALIYTRVSTEDQAREGVSLDAQLATCRRYAAAHGWVLGREYKDVQSGKRDDRPEYQALLAHLRQQHATEQYAVVVMRLDRLGRRLLERVRAWEEFKALGVAVHSANEGGAVPELVANVLASVAQEESRQTGERISTVKQHLMSLGWSHGGRIPWGYRSRPTTEAERRAGAPTHILDPDPLTAPYVREVFTRLASGESLRSVVRWVATLPTAARGGRQLTYGSLQGTVRAPVYIARVSADGAPGHWPPLVDDATWYTAQAQLAQHARLPRQASARHLLTGLLRCPRCRQRLQGTRRTRGSSPAGRIYTCGIGAANGQCSYSVGPAAALDDGVLAAVSALLDAVTTHEPGARRALQDAWRQLQTPPPRGPAAGERRELEQTIEQARRRLRDAAALLVDGALDRTGYELVRETEQGALDAATAALEALAPTPAPLAWPTVGAVLAQVGDWQGVLAMADLATVRPVLAHLIERVVPHAARRPGQPYPEIHWTPLGVTLGELAAAVTPLRKQMLAG